MKRFASKQLFLLLLLDRLTVLVTLLFVTVPVYSQDLTGREADSLNLLLNHAMPDTNRLDILFRLAEFYINKPGDYKQDLDNATEILEKTKLINLRLNSEDISGFQTLIASMLAKERKQQKQGKAMAERALRMLYPSSNKYYLGKAYFSLSDYYAYSDRTELVEKIRLVEMAVQNFALSNNIEAYANGLKYLADLYEINEQKSKVLEYLNLSLKMYKSINYPKLYGVYVLYNRYYYLRGNYKLALDYCLMALTDAERAGDSTLSYCQINNYMGITLVHLKERERATGYYKVALQIAEKCNDNTCVQLVMNNMVRNYIDLKKPQEALDLMKSIPKAMLIPTSGEGYILSSLCYASIYFELKKYRETGVYCNEILELFKRQMPRAQVVNDFYQVLIGYYLETKQYTSAGIYLHKIDSLSRKLDDPARIKDNYYLAFRLDTAKGSLRSAIVNLLRFQDLHDSLFDETSSRQMQQMEVEYETEKNKNEIRIKDQDIVLLNQKNQLQQIGLERGKLVRNFIIGGVVLLLVILALLYRQYRNKRKINQMIVYKNELLEHLITEKEWLVKEIHHRVKNNLQIVVSLLNTQAAHLQEGDALIAIQQSRHRIQVISLLHQKLYQAETSALIDMQVYIREVVSYLKESFSGINHLYFNQHIDAISLDIAQAVPVGLILNEAITNCIKYAFPNNITGNVIVSFTKEDDECLLLTIADNGIGIAKDIDLSQRNSLGIQLMQTLSEQLDGNIKIESLEGTVVKVYFRDQGIKKTNRTSEHFKNIAEIIS
ncbi:MAG: histidine kinase dimerization/phosphoacceptor domain -containing protein [Ferruginibacter sp.]